MDGVVSSDAAPCVLTSWDTSDSALSPTPRPLAVWHRYRHGLPHEGYLLTEKVEDAFDLRSFVVTPASDARRRMPDSSPPPDRSNGPSDRPTTPAPSLAPRFEGRQPARPRRSLLHFIRSGRGASPAQKSAVRAACKIWRLNASFLHNPGLTRGTDRLRFLHLTALGTTRPEWLETLVAADRGSDGT